MANIGQAREDAGRDIWNVYQFLWQILDKYWTNIGQILDKYCTNIGQARKDAGRDIWNV